MNHQEQVGLLKQTLAKINMLISDTEMTYEFDPKSLLDLKQRAAHLSVLIDYFNKYGHLPICDETLGG